MNFFSKHNDTVIKNVLVSFAIEAKNTGKAFMSYGDGDYVLTGDYVTTPPLTSPTRVHVGSEPDAGFNFVVVSLVLLRSKWYIIYSWPH